jgi:hypothetical protein
MKDGDLDAEDGGATTPPNKEDSMSTRRSFGLGLAIGLLAMAFAAFPAFAGAAQLTDPAGSVEVGETVSATSTNAVTKFESGNALKCAHVDIHGIVTKNSGGTVMVTMDEEGEDTATGCKLNEALSVVIQPTLTSITLTPTAKTAVFDFSAPELGLTETSTSAVTYTSPATKVHVEGPVAGSAEGTFSGDFVISDGSGAITVD